jgi:hypothetical protein
VTIGIAVPFAVALKSVGAVGLFDVETKAWIVALWPESIQTGAGPRGNGWRVAEVGKPPQNWEGLVLEAGRSELGQQRGWW